MQFKEVAVHLPLCVLHRDPVNRKPAQLGCLQHLPLCFLCQKVQQPFSIYLIQRADIASPLQRSHMQMDSFLTVERENLTKLNGPTERLPAPRSDEPDEHRNWNARSVSLHVCAMRKYRAGECGRVGVWERARVLTAHVNRGAELPLRGHVCSRAHRGRSVWWMWEFRRETLGCCFYERAGGEEGVRGDKI